WLAAVGMGVAGFAILFAGVVSSVLASASLSLLLAFILPVATKAPASDIQYRLAGWGMALGASMFAISLLWPSAAHDPIRAQAVAACRALAARLRADIDYRRGGMDPAGADAHMQAVVTANDSVAALHKAFLATPYRPTGLSTPARTIVRLIDEINWLNTAVVKSSPKHKHAVVGEAALQVKADAAVVLDLAAGVLADTRGDDGRLHDAVDRMRGALAAMEREATHELPVRSVTSGSNGNGDAARVVEIVTSLDPSFRAQELSFAVEQIAANVERTAAAERRGLVDRLLGRQPEGIAGTLSAAQERAAAHFERHSVWLHNSVRGAIGLAVAIFIATETGVQHSFWVVLGTLSVLRSNALSTGQNILRGLLGTVAGFVIGALLLQAIGTDTTVLWFLLPLAILVAGVAPAAISFAAGQAAFTLTLLILFNIIVPTGWRVGIVRIEDIAIGSAVSLAVGLLFWPRGAAAALGVALAEGYADSAAYLASAVQYGVSRCDRSGEHIGPTPDGEAVIAAASARRLDDTFRNYLAERGAKPVPISEITGLLTGVASLRQAADAVVDIWRRDDAVDRGDRSAARRELLSAAAMLRAWFDDFGGSLTNGSRVPEATDHDEDADARLIAAVRSDLTCDDGLASATAVRVIWTGDHLDAVRRMQGGLVEPARTAIAKAGIAARADLSWFAVPLTWAR
ncbi:MAG TPA: FUSC family protein, partial [Jatrophihabitantaceae bacterium]|nr:FUSC family protein [Jatrophihabitantaceae bacterium]